MMDLYVYSRELARDRSLEKCIINYAESLIVLSILRRRSQSNLSMSDKYTSPNSREIKWQKRVNERVKEVDVKGENCAVVREKRIDCMGMREREREREWKERWIDEKAVNVSINLRISTKTELLLSLSQIIFPLKIHNDPLPPPLILADYILS